MTTCRDLVSETERHFLLELDELKQYSIQNTHKIFWNDLPNQKKGKTDISEINLIAKHYVESIFEEILEKNESLIQEVETKNLKKKYLCEKYFKKWKDFVDIKKEKRHEELVKGQKEKLELFIKRFKKHKKNEKTKQPEDKNDIEKKVQIMVPKPSSKYKNRFKAQKSIIELQKAKLEEQNRIIQDLKLGIINEDIEKSMDRAKINIREIFANCSSSIKYKIPLILGEEPRFSVSTQGAPKIVQKMEQKALERAQNREIILERKRIIEEKRQKMVAEAVENKRVLEEEEKKLSLELIKERRRKELELDRIRQINKQIFLEKWNKAVQFYNKLLLKSCLKKLYNNMQKSREKSCLANQHYQNGLLKKCINYLAILVENSYKIKYDMADAHFEYKTLKICMATWRKAHLESIRNMQVAEDIYDFRLVSNVFTHWNRYACIQFMKQKKNAEKADNHYKRWLLFHYFYQWRSLKAVIQLERAKEIKKERWRQKVWEILPDYKPPEDDFL